MPRPEIEIAASRDAAAPRRSIHSLQHAQLTAPEARQRLQELLELLGDDRYQVRLDIEVWSEES